MQEYDDRWEQKERGEHAGSPPGFIRRWNLLKLLELSSRSAYIPSSRHLSFSFSTSAPPAFAFSLPPPGLLLHATLSAALLLPNFGPSEAG